MLRTIDRYVIREIIPPFLLSLLIFTFILEIPPVMDQLERLVAKGVSGGQAVRILMTLLPQALGLTIPMSLLTGLLIGLGRLSADREGVALLACGVSPYRLLRPILLIALLATGATFYVMVEAIPNANQTFRDITWDIITKRVENDIKPRVFFTDFPGWVMYPREEAPGGGWRDVLVADTTRPESVSLFMADRARLLLDREKRVVDLILSHGVQYSSGKPGETNMVDFPGDQRVSLNGDAVFQRVELGKGPTEQTIAELRATIKNKRDNKISQHPEILALEQKFSIPIACLVFAVIGLALGLTVARDTKMGAYVIGIAVIFAYYTVLVMAESATKGYYSDKAPMDRILGQDDLAHAARWLPNLVLGAFGVAALIWRARFAERGLPFNLSLRLPERMANWGRRTPPPTPSAPAPVDAQAAPRAGQGLVVVVRIPRLRLPSLGLLDRYISTIYLRIIGLSFVALLGLFYISTAIDKTDKVFKGQASTRMLVQFLGASTPQFVYFVIPLAALLSVLVTFGILSRTSELTVMKACGVSLYRAALPVVALSLAWSVVLFALDQGILAAANRQAKQLDDRIRGRPPRNFSPLNRQWLVGRDGRIYHYGFYDVEHKALTNLSVFQIDEKSWRLVSRTFAATSEFRSGEWTGMRGWVEDFTTRPPRWTPFPTRSLALESTDYFETEQPDADAMTVQQLRKYADEVAASGLNALPQRVELQKRLAFPFVTFVMTLLAVPFGVTTGRRGTLYGIGIGIVIALCYWVGVSVFVAIGSAGLLSPVLSGWTPNIIVVACAVFLVLRART